MELGLAKGRPCGHRTHARAGRLSLDGRATSGTIGYTYDAQDNLASVTEHLGHVTSYDYSGFNGVEDTSRAATQA